MDRPDYYSKEDGKKIFIKSGHSYFALNYDEISRIEGLKDYVIFHTQKEKHIVYHSLKKLIAKLPDDFMRIHNSYIINVNYVKEISGNQVFIGNEQLPIGKSYKSCLIDSINKKII